MLKAGLPAPETQLLVVTTLGDSWCDLGIREYGLYIEYDGEANYTANGAASDAVCAERDRERAIEAVVKSPLIRLTNNDIVRPGEYLRQVCDRLPSVVVRAARPRRLLMP